MLGSHWGDFRSSESFALGFLERGMLGLSPLVFPNTVMNAMAAQVSIAVGVRGPMLTLNEVDVAGELAVARGAALIASGRASVVLAGGSDELSPILYRELSRLGTMSRRRRGPRAAGHSTAGQTAPFWGRERRFWSWSRRSLPPARGARIYAELARRRLGQSPGARPRVSRARGDATRGQCAARSARRRSVRRRWRSRTSPGRVIRSTTRASSTSWPGPWGRRAAPA